MRVGVNTRVLLSSRMEGVCRYMHETLRRMVFNNPDTEFVFFFDRPYDEMFVYADNVTPVVLSPPARHAVLFYYWFEWVIPKALKKHKIDVFYSPDTYLSLKTKVPTVLVTHDIAYHHYPEHLPWINRKYYEYFFPRFHKKAAQILAVSEFTRQDVIKAYDLDSKRVEVAYNSVKEGIRVLPDSAKAKVRKKYAEGKKYLLYVGAIHPRKNVVRVIEAFDTFKKKHPSDLKLVLVARMAWNPQAFKKALAAAECRADIIQLKELYSEEVNQITAAAEASVYVSLFEGFGLPILEAMASGVPVITSNVSSMPEVSQDAAIQVDPLKISEIADAMDQIVNNATLRKSLIAKGLDRAKNFDWDRTADITFNALKHAKV